MLSNVRLANDAALRREPPGPIRQANRDLARALNDGDAAAASQAYARLVDAMPDAVQVKPGTPLARVGEALAAGDVQAAKSAYADLFRLRRNPEPMPPVPVPSSTGGASGTLVNTVA